jgi:hypothetical protein
MVAFPRPVWVEVLQMAQGRVYRECPRFAEVGRGAATTKLKLRNKASLDKFRIENEELRSFSLFFILNSKF